MSSGVAERLSNDAIADEDALLEDLELIKVSLLDQAVSH